MKNYEYLILNLRILIIAALLAVSLTNCNKDNEDNNNVQEGDGLLIVNPERQRMSDDGTSFFEITLSNTEETEWRIEGHPEWLILEPSSGTIKQGEKQKINITVGDHGSNSESANLYFKFLSDCCFSVNVNIYIELDGYSYNNLHITPEELFIPSGATESNFKILHNSSNSVTYTISNIPDYITVTQAEGILDQENPQTIKLDINRDGLDSLVYNCNLTITNSLNSQKTIAINIENHNEGNIWDLPYKIIDAEFSYAFNKIVAVDYNSKVLLIINPITKTLTEIALPKKPICVSVSPDGKYAAVGYDVLCSLIDIQNKTLTNNYTLNISAFDIIMTSNERIYIFPNVQGNSNAGINSINTQTGELNSNAVSSYYNIMTAKLHVSENYIYTKEVNSGSNRIEKYSLLGDTVSFLYEIGTNQNYTSFNNFWLTKEGDKVITQARTILSSTEEEETDLQYITRLTSDSGISSVDDNTEKNIFCAILYNYNQNNLAGRSMFTYSLDNLAPLDTIPLPKYFIPGSTEFYNPDGQFVFIEEDGETIWVIMKAEEDFPKPFSYRIVGFEL